MTVLAICSQTSSGEIADDSIRPALGTSDETALGWSQQQIPARSLPRKAVTYLVA
jgi:hypothetical protein